MLASAMEKINMDWDREPVARLAKDNLEKVKQGENLEQF